MTCHEMILEQDLQNPRRQNNDHGQVSTKLDIELDLQSLFGLHVHSFTHWLKPRNLFCFKYRKTDFNVKSFYMYMTCATKRVVTLHYFYC
jgi:hypothetical protein